MGLNPPNPPLWVRPWFEYVWGSANQPTTTVEVYWHAAVPRTPIRPGWDHCRRISEVVRRQGGGSTLVDGISAEAWLRHRSTWCVAECLRPCPLQWSSEHHPSTTGQNLCCRSSAYFCSQTVSWSCWWHFIFPSHSDQQIFDGGSFSRDLTDRVPSRKPRIFFYNGSWLTTAG